LFIAVKALYPIISVEEYGGNAAAARGSGKCFEDSPGFD
jgi:hypothetical protein